jgi:hypothetical protein
MTYTGGTRPLLVSFTNDMATDEQMRGVLDGLPEILYWYQCITGQIFVVSTVPAPELAEDIEIIFKQRAMKHMFYVTEIFASNIQGRLPDEAWMVIAQGHNWPPPNMPIPGAPGVPRKP